MLARTRLDLVYYSWRTCETWRTATCRARAQAPAQPQRPAGPQHQAMLNDKVDKLEVVVQLQQKMIGTLTAQLKEQAAQIQKVSAELEMSKPAPQVVTNKP